jgi:hypothetical protein
MKEQIKFFAVPAAVVAGWLTLCALSLASVSHPGAIHESIDKVLAHRDVVEASASPAPAIAQTTGGDDEVACLQSKSRLAQAPVR